MFQQLPRPTKTYHTKPYPAISPSRPELSLEGKKVLITAGGKSRRPNVRSQTTLLNSRKGTGIGLAITSAVAQAGAASIALFARREQSMLDAKASIESQYLSTKVETYTGSLTKTEDIKRALAAAGHIDILVLSAGSSHNPGPTSSIPLSEIRADFDTNVIGTIDFIQQFVALPSESERTLIHVSTAGAYLEGMGVAGYGASKLAASHYVRNLASEVTGLGRLRSIRRWRGRS
jgi:NAD(P)-dependent dehydrogenase (short-subunit alcohol dehydrogenase family)